MKKGVIIVILLALLGGVGFGFKKKIMDFINPPPQPWAPDLDPVLVYNPAFAQRFGLDPNKAVQLEPGVLAVAMTFRKDYKYDFDPEKGNGSDAISVKRIFDQITRDEWYEVDRHLAILPLLFPQKYNSNTLDQRYFENCKINFYLDSTDSRVAQIDMQPHSLWVTGDIQDALDSLWYGHARPEELNLENLNMIHQHVLLFGMGTFENVGDGYGLNQNHLVNFLPGITFISFSTVCDLAKNYPQGTLVWFEKKNGPDYFLKAKAGSNPDYALIPENIHTILMTFSVFIFPYNLRTSPKCPESRQNHGLLLIIYGEKLCAQALMIPITGNVILTSL